MCFYYNLYKNLDSRFFKKFISNINVRKLKINQKNIALQMFYPPQYPSIFESYMSEV